MQTCRGGASPLLPLLSPQASTPGTRGRVCNSSGCWGQKGQISLHRAVLEASEMLKVRSLVRSSHSPGCFGVSAHQLGSTARGTSAAAPLYQCWGYHQCWAGVTGAG